MESIKQFILIGVLSISFLCCKQKEGAKSTKMDIIPQKTIELIGSYASSAYEKRDEGYDWVGVSVTKNTDSTIHISIRSRADKKEPTCTFDAEALKLNETTYQSNFEGKDILYVFNKTSLTIKTKLKEEISTLNYFCSGGASLAATYTKLNKGLDQTQIDKTIFNKTLSLQNISFEISSTGKGSFQYLKIKPFGLEIDNSEINMKIDGSIVNAEIEDLNSDGFPEILVYSVSAGSGSYGNVIGYSVNNGKSISQIYFPPISENLQVNKGYMGHDAFAIVETTLMQRFQTYNEGDTNANPTGNIRQIQYKLIDGESSRRFVIDKVIEYPTK